MRIWKFLNERTGAVALSLFSNSLLIVLKIIVGLYTGSVSILSEAIHSSSDLLAAIIAFVAIRHAAKPADWNHPYGHGKSESLSAAVEALLIFVAAGVIIYEAVQRLLHGATVENLEWGIGVMLFASLANFLVSRHLFRVAKRTESPALAADAWHLSTDLYTALGVGVGLILVRITGVRALDPIVAIAVALFIVRAAWNITRGSVADLLDESLPANDEAKIHQILLEHRDLYARIRTMRTRRAGSHRHVYIALEFPPGASLAYAHEYAVHLEQDIQRAFSDITAVVEAEPSRQREDSPGTIAETVERLARRSNLSVHQFNIYWSDDRWNAAIDLGANRDVSGPDLDRLCGDFQRELRRAHPALGEVEIEVIHDGADAPPHYEHLPSTEQETESTRPHRLSER